MVGGCVDKKVDGWMHGGEWVDRMADGWLGGHVGGLVDGR